MWVGSLLLPFPTIPYHLVECTFNKVADALTKTAFFMVRENGCEVVHIAVNFFKQRVILALHCGCTKSSDVSVMKTFGDTSKR